MSAIEAYKCDRCGEETDSETYYKRWIRLNCSGSRSWTWDFCEACRNGLLIWVDMLGGARSTPT